jgi:uncharacterized membrane protein YkoI
MQKRWNPKLLTAAFAGTFLALTAAPAWSNDDHESGQRSEHREEHDEARYLVNRGNIRPLPEVLRAVQLHVSGEIIDVRLRSKDLRWIYLCKVVTPTGRRVVVTIDAATLAILEGEHHE